MARTAIGWGVRDLARVAKLSPDTVARFERGESLKEVTVSSIQRTLEEAGIEFVKNGVIIKDS
jgi:transcriptional regulator with XRE-family HTH domain